MFYDAVALINAVLRHDDQAERAILGSADTAELATMLARMAIHAANSGIPITSYIERELDEAEGVL